MWVMPFSVVEFLDAWKGLELQRRSELVGTWETIPHCLSWVLWSKRRVVDISRKGSGLLCILNFYSLIFCSSGRMKCFQICLLLL